MGRATAMKPNSPEPRKVWVEKVIAPHFFLAFCRIILPSLCCCGIGPRLGQSASSQAANSARTAALPRGLMSAKATHCTNTNYSSSVLRFLRHLFQKLNAVSKARPKNMSIQQAYAKSRPKQVRLQPTRNNFASLGDHTEYMQ